MDSTTGAIKHSAMCNRFHQSAKAAELARTIHGLVIPEDFTFPPPQLFPTGKKTARHGVVARRSSEGNRPLIVDRMEWGVPTTVPGKTIDKATGKPKPLTKFVTNARNLASPFWRSMVADPARRCLVPFTHFAEPREHPEKGDDGLPPQWWFSLPEQPIACFAGLWRPTERGPAFAFATTEPNDLVRPVHPKAMPAILHGDEFTAWLEAPADEALALIRPYDGPMERQVVTPPLPESERDVGAPEIYG